MNIFDKIRDSAYQPKSDYPSYTVTQPLRDKKIAKYHTEQAELKEQFFLDLCEHHNVKPSGRMEKLFKFAWENAHSGGHNEVVLFMDELVKLVNSLYGKIYEDSHN